MGQLRDQLPEVRAMEGHIDYMDAEAMAEERKIRDEDMIDLAKRVYDISHKYNMPIVAHCLAGNKGAGIMYGDRYTAWYEPGMQNK